MTKEELAKKYNVSINDIEKAFVISDSEFQFGVMSKVPTPESLLEHWFGNKTLPPVWRTK